MPRSPFELNCPSPVRRLEIDAPAELWLKDDSRISEVYGGNKPRKLACLLKFAQEQGARRLVTAGAIGSHHVLATGLLGQRMGLTTTALAVPRPYSSHVEQTIQQTLAAGVELVPLSHPKHLVGALWRLRRLRGDSFIPPGGSNGLGSIGYLRAARELKRQIDEGLLPEPDIIVVALGTGGTAAGLLAGCVSLGLRTRVMAVPVLRIRYARLLVQTLARSCLRLDRPIEERADLATKLAQSLVIDPRWLGRGYGYPTAAGELAVAQAAELGLSLEETYTGKAFACALALLRGFSDRGNVEHPNALAPVLRRGERVLFWSTFSGVPLIAAQSSQVTIPAALRALLRAP